jgi:hypothetical protein
MENTIFYTVPLFFTAFISVAIIAIRSPRKRLPEELGLYPEIEEICGGRISSLNYTWPLVRHSIYKEFVVIKCLGGKYLFPRAGIVVESADGVISTGIRYKTSKYLGCDLRIWTKRKHEVLAKLKNV